MVFDFHVRVHSTIFEKCFKFDSYIYYFVCLRKSSVDIRSKTGYCVDRKIML